MAFSFSSLLPPSIMLKLIRQKLEDELNAHFKIYEPAKVPFIVTEFVTLIDFKQNRIDFLVEGKKYPLADYKKFMTVVNDAVKERVGDFPVDIVAINYTQGKTNFFGPGVKEKITATVAYIKDGIPTQETHDL